MSWSDFEWRRLWRKQDLRVQVKLATTAETSIAARPLLATLEELADVKCLVLLGAPGIGKSYELQRAYRRSVADGERAVMASLRAIRNPRDLEVLVARNAVTTMGITPLYLFLDGLDEAAVPVTDLFGWVVEAIKRLSSQETCYIRLTSRPTSWLQGYEEDLRSLCGSQNVEVYDLAPLTAEDVRTAVIGAIGGEAEVGFVEQFKDNDTYTLLQLPVTLKMLLDVVAAGGSIPKRRVEIYRRGLLALVERTDAARPTRSNKLAGEEKLLIAGRIAAAAILSNRHLIWTGLYAGAPAEGVLAIQDIAGGEEECLGSSYRVTESELRQIVESGIFSRRSDSLYTWVHLSFAEFLAGYYLASHVGDSSQLIRLLSPRTELSSRLAPQMREVVAWASALVPEFFTHVAATEPEILLSSDALTGDDGATKRILAELLRLLEHDHSPILSELTRSRFGRFYHPDLADQLKPFILEKTHGVDARRVAVEIAGDTKLTALATDLVDVARDTAEDDQLRAAAVLAIKSIGIFSALNDLRNAVSSSWFSSVSDDLRGAFLSTLWPNVMPIEMLFRTLTAPQQPSVVSLYRLFLHELRIDALTPAQSVVALDWITTLKFDDWTESNFDKIIAAVLQKTWRNIGEPEVLQAFARLIIASQEQHHVLFYRGEFKEFKEAYASSSGSDHRALFIEIHLLASPSQFERTIATPWQLLSPNDIEWLLKELRTGQSTLPKKWLISAIFWVTGSNQPDEIAELWDIAEGDPEFAFVLQRRFTSELDSQVTIWQREDFKRQQNKRPKPPAAAEQLAALLEKSRVDSFLWWQINLALLNSDNSDERLDEFTSNIAVSPGWKAASANDRTYLLSLARRYLVENAVDEEQSLKAGTFHRPAAAGLRALRLLRAEDRQSYDTLSVAVWHAWMAPILSTSTNDSAEGTNVRSEIARDAYMSAPDKFLIVLGTVLAVC